MVRVMVYGYVGVRVRYGGGFQGEQVCGVVNVVYRNNAGDMTSRLLVHQ